MEYSLLGQATKITAASWKHRWRSRLDMFDVYSQLAGNYIAHGVEVKASNSSSDSVRFGAFSGLQLGAREIVAYCCGTLI